MVGRRDHKDRKRARRLLDEAWEALQSSDLVLADKLSKRATAECASYPAAHCERGEILIHAQRFAEADRALRHALALDPRFVEAFAALSRLYEAEDKPAKALEFARRALQSSPRDRGLQSEVRRLEAALPAQRAANELERAVARGAGARLTLSERVSTIDLRQLRRRLVEDGAARLPSFLSGLELEACAGLASAWERSGDGVVERAIHDIPPRVAAMQEELYVAVARIAELRERSLGKAEADDGGDAEADSGNGSGGVDGALQGSLRWPPSLPDLQLAGDRVGQSRFLATELSVEAGAAWKSAECEAAPTIDFPFALACGLGPGELVMSLQDRRQGKRIKERSWALEQGDVLVYALRSRLRRVGGIWGLQPLSQFLRASDHGELSARALLLPVVGS